jgi:hypothetical protein
VNELLVSSVVLCEATRLELGNKHTLLGATAPELDIAVTESTTFPLFIQIALFIIGKPSSEGDFSAHLRILDVANNEVVKAKLDGVFSNRKSTSLAIGPMLIPLTSEGDCIVQWHFGDEQWKELQRIKFNFNKQHAT